MQWNMTNVFGENLTITELEEGQNYTISITPVSCSRQPGIAKHVFGITTEAGAASDVQNLTILFQCFVATFFAVPSGAPTITNVLATSETTIFVSWTEVDCLEQNGIVTNYRISLLKSGVSIYNETVNGTVYSKEILINLSIQLNNSAIKIAAVNSAGEGESHIYPVQITGELMIIMSK